MKSLFLENIEVLDLENIEVLDCTQNIFFALFQIISKLKDCESLSL